jgi:hypothetical protein
MAKAPQQTGGGGTKVVSPGAFTIRSMGSTTLSKWINVLVYGKHGAGKTTLAASSVDVPEMNDVLVVLAEGGEIVLEDNDRIVDYENADVVKVDRIEQFQKIYEFLKAHCSMRDNPDKETQLQELQTMVFGEFDGRLRRYRTVILDSLTELEAYNLTKILDLDSIGLDAGDDMEVAGFGEFRKNMHIMQRAVRQFRDLPIHFIATCAEAYTQDERKAFSYTLKLTGQLSNIMQGFFDIVGRLVVGKAASENESAPRRLFVQPQASPKADAKCRLAGYKKDYFDDPVMRDIMVGTGYIKSE